jgi:hypothetical protein
LDSSQLFEFDLLKCSTCSIWSWSFCLSTLIFVTKLRLHSDDL